MKPSGCLIPPGMSLAFGERLAGPSIPIPSPSTHLTCAPTAVVEELEGPPFPVIHILESVGATPGLSVCLHLLTVSPALQGPTDIACLSPQGRAAALQAKGFHRHASTGKLCLCLWETAAAQVAQPSPQEPPQGSHYNWV